jgi:hypothetical protein
LASAHATAFGAVNIFSIAALLGCRASKRKIVMRGFGIAGAVALIGLSLSGCAVASAAGTVVGAAGTVVGTAVDVGSDVVGAAAGAATGGDSKDDKKPD